MWITFSVKQLAFGLFHHQMTPRRIIQQHRHDVIVHLPDILEYLLIIRDDGGVLNSPDFRQRSNSPLLMIASRSVMKYAAVKAFELDRLRGIIRHDANKFA